jgi:predicted lipid carrier protein YhbT
MIQDAEVDKEILRQTLARATETFLENKILIKEFNDVGLDFTVMVKQEELNIFKRYTL